MGRRLGGIVAAGLCALLGAGAAAQQPAQEAPQPHLHVVAQSCGERKAKRQAGKLEQGQLQWMLSGVHRMYALNMGERTLATIELLSSGDYRGCDLQQRWDERETQVRVTYFMPGGETKVSLERWKDPAIFDKPPKIYLPSGRAFFNGQAYGGGQSSRWLEMPLLGEIYSQAKATAVQGVAPTLSSTALATPRASASPAGNGPALSIKTFYFDLNGRR